jgi:hypothetical protein
MRRIWDSVLRGCRIILFPPDGGEQTTSATGFRAGWDLVVRSMFAVYYLPVLLVVVGSLIDTLLHIAFAALMPSVQADAPDMEVLDPFRLAQHWLSVWFVILPYVAVMLGVLTLAHNALKIVGEAMVDSFAVFNHVDYSLTLGLLTFSLESPRRVLILAIVSSVLTATFAVVFLTDVVLLWTKRDAGVRITTWTIVVVQLAACSVSAMRLAMQENPLKDYPHPDSPRPPPRDTLLWMRAFVIVWWRANIGRVRHAAMNMLGAFTVVWTVMYGPLRALEMGVETLIYLNLPNLLGFCCLATSQSITRGLHCYEWLRRHRQYVKAVAVLIAPYSMCWLYTLLFFQFSLGVTVMTVFSLLILTVHAIGLCKQHQVSKNGAVQWFYEDVPSPRMTPLPPGATGSSSAGSSCKLTPLPVTLASELEDAVQRKFQRPALVSLELRCNLKTMTLESRVDFSVRRLQRIVNRNPATAPPPRLWRVIRTMLPRLLLFQSRHAFTGTKFNRTRIVLKIVTTVLTLILFAIVGGAVVQETMSFLRPAKMMAEKFSHQAERDRDGSSGSEELVVRHLVIDLFIRFDTQTPPGDASGSPIPTDDLGTLCIRDHLGVSVFEMGLLTVASYLHDRLTVVTYVDGLNAALDADWAVVYPGLRDFGPSRPSRKAWKSLVELRSEARNVTLVIVRGTDFTSFFDVLQDVSVYAESFLFQVMTHIVPGAHLMPATLVTDAIELAAALEVYLVPWVDRRIARNNVFERHFHDIVARYVSTKFEKPEDMQRVVLIGHSLGGAIAHIAAAKVGAKSFGFQSPGVVLPRKKLGLTTAQLHRTTTTIIASDDIVPNIGWQAGELLHFDCAETYRERCHALEATVATMWRDCESLRRRYPRIHNVTVK